MQTHRSTQPGGQKRQRAAARTLFVCPACVYRLRQAKPNSTTQTIHLQACLPNCEEDILANVAKMIQHVQKHPALPNPHEHVVDLTKVQEPSRMPLPHLHLLNTIDVAAIIKQLLSRQMRSSLRCIPGAADPAQWRHNHTYVHTNLDSVPERGACSHLHTLFHILCSSVPEGGCGLNTERFASQLEAAEEDNAASLKRTVLLMLGAEGTGTGVHMDYTNAVNIALCCPNSQTQCSEVLAQWLFFRPGVHSYPTKDSKGNDITQTMTTVQRIDQLLRAENRPGILATDSNFPPQHVMGAPVSHETMLYISQHPDMREHVILKDQRHGDIITVEPAWAHAVINLKPCLKLAYDRFLVRTLPLCVATHYMYHSRIFYATNAEDYAGVLYYQFAELSRLAARLLH